MRVLWIGRLLILNVSLANGVGGRPRARGAGASLATSTFTTSGLASRK